MGNVNTVNYVMWKDEACPDCFIFQATFFQLLILYLYISYNFSWWKV